MNTDPQPINLSNTVNLSKMIKTKNEAKEKLYNSVISLFVNNKDNINDLLKKFNANLYNLDGDSILVDPNNHDLILICYTDVLSITKDPVLFDFSNNEFLTVDASGKKRSLNKEETIRFLSDESCLDAVINVADPNKLILQSTRVNADHLSEINLRLRNFNE